MRILCLAAALLLLAATTAAQDDDGAAPRAPSAVRWPKDEFQEADPCDADEQALWRRLYLRVREIFPRMSGRMRLTVHPADYEALSALQMEVAEVAPRLDSFFDGKVPAEWDECTIGAFTTFMVLILFGTVEEPDRIAAMVSERLAYKALAVPWATVLLSGWPLFEALQTLSRRASPHAPTRESDLAGAGGLDAKVAADSAAALEPSRCDAAEVGAVQAARRLLSSVWRRRDPSAIGEEVPLASPAPMASPDAEVVGAVEEALAFEQGSSWSGRSGLCRWTEHPGRVLGGLVGASAEAEAPGAEGGDGEGVGDRLVRMMAACEEEPSCAGVSASASSGGPVMSLRQGDTFLAQSPQGQGEMSWARWCSAVPPTFLKEASSGQSLPGCPFARSVALLARARRRLVLSGSGISTGGRRGIENFEPELVIEAQAVVADWAALVGTETAGMESWTTEWPLWDALARVEQRLQLLGVGAVDFASGLGEPSKVAAPPPALELAPLIQRATGLTDEALRLAAEELAALAAGDSAASVPDEIREHVHCSSGKHCLAELFARLHVLLSTKGVLPLRDTIFIDSEDSLAPLHIQKSYEFMKVGDYDWARLWKQSGHGHVQREEELDLLMPGNHPLQVDRLQLANFVLNVREHVGDRQFGRCLEWDQPFLLIRAFRGVCRCIDIFTYSEPSGSNPYMGMPGMSEYNYGTRHYWGDLEHPGGFGVEPDTFDLVVAPFVFEHVSQPFLAMKNLAATVRPGGYIIWAAPMFQEYHGSPNDYFRFTPKGARALADSAGLETVMIYAPGDVGLVTGVMLGLMLPYWTRRQALEQQEPSEGDDSPKHPLNVFALLRKPVVEQ